MANVEKKAKVLSKRQKEMMSRFRLAYERLSFHHKRDAKRQFCEIHRVTAGTFANKMNGFNPLSEAEIMWMEAFDPYTHHQPVEAA